MITDEQKQTAKKNGISYQTLYKRVFEYGWDIQQAINTPSGKRFGNPVKKFTEEELALAKKNGISHSALCNRIRKGWDRQKALTTPPMKNDGNRQYGFKNYLVSIGG